MIIGRVGTTFRFRTRRVCVVEPLRSLILAAADNDVIRRVVATAPGSRQIVARFVAGESVADALEVVHTITADGRRATLDYLASTQAIRSWPNERSALICDCWTNWPSGDWPKASR